MTQLVEYMKQYKLRLEKNMIELQEQMEQLDMNSKAFVELDFEYNWVNGQFVAVSHLLQESDKMKVA